MTEPKASLRERTILAAEEHESAHYFNRDQKLSYIAGANHGPPVEFAIEILSRIKLDALLTAYGQRDDIADLADEALSEIRKARGEG